MRIRLSPTLGVLGIGAAIAATLAIASAAPTRAAAACGCGRATHAARHHHAHAVKWRHVVHSASRTYARIDSQAWSAERRWGAEHAWRDEHDWSEAHGWREGGREEGWSERPWATDQFGFLTWPGKSHF